MITLFDTKAASQWLAEHGVHRTSGTLRKLRCVGGGPRYRVLNGRPHYTADDLAAWVESRLSESYGSTSEEPGPRGSPIAATAHRHRSTAERNPPAPRPRRRLRTSRPAPEPAPARAAMPTAE